MTWISMNKDPAFMDLQLVCLEWFHPSHQEEHDITFDEILRQNTRTHTHVYLELLFLDIRPVYTHEKQNLRDICASVYHF